MFNGLSRHTFQTTLQFDQTLIRIFLIILMFTPSLGLFETLHHGRLATLDTYYGERMFDNSINGLPLTFYDSWKPFKIKDMAEFPGMPLRVVLTVMVSLCVFHILASAFILKVMLKEKFSGGLLMQGLHSFVAPPLQFDWELFYRDEHQNMSVLHSWRRYGGSAKEVLHI